MRIIATIPHPKILISVFSMNDKYQVQFEAGPMSQTFKFSHSEVQGVEGIQKLLDEEFMKKVNERFNEMFLSYTDAKKRQVSL
jgi:hypothetical protein